MPIHNQWLIPQRVIISQASGVVTLVEFIASSQQVRQMLHSLASQGKLTCT
jgi:hypothetical protein